MKRYLAGCIFLLSSITVFAQPKTLIDDIVAIVGSEVILRSDVENQVQQLFLQGMAERGEKTFCAQLEQHVVQKMLLMQAEFDSLPVTDDQVNSEMERRLQIFIQQAGGRDKLEEALGKTIDEIKIDFATVIRDQLLIQQMQQSITGKARVTPGEVRTYFNNIPKDSLPYIPSEVQIGQLTIKPPIRQEERDKVVRQLNDLREQIMEGSSFSLKAKIYSEDPGSAANGGELGFLRREDLVENFAAAAFSLENTDTISGVVETEYGYHIIQLIEKRGEYANFRHILIKPKVLTTDIYATVARLDSIYQEVKKGTISFATAAARFSTDEVTRNNGGLLINPVNGSTLFTLDELAEIDGQTFRTIESLTVGEMTKPAIFEDAGGKTVKILYLVSKTNPHIASLDTDYAKIQNAALQDKQSTMLNEWVETKKDDFYIKIADEFKTCAFEVHWFNKKSQ